LAHATFDVTLMIEPVRDDDPPPIPPVRPGIDECCRSACNPCIFEVYEEALERYRADLRAWEVRKAADDSETQ